jgi:hypothetical protein
VHRLLSGLLCGLLAAFSASSATPQETQVTLLSGEIKTVANLAFSNDKFSGEGLPDTPLDEVLSIDTQNRPLPAVKAALVINLAGGGQLPAQSLLIEDEKCQIETLSLDKFTLPLDALRGFRAEEGNRENYDRALANPSPKSDRIFLKVDGKVESLPGTLESLAELEFAFDYEGDKRTMPRERLFGVVLSASASADEAKCRVALLDGSRVAGEPISLAAGKLTLKLGRKGTLAIPWDMVGTITLKSDRLTYLSELKPIAEEQQVLVAFPMPWQKDRSVTGKPLLIAGKRYSRGVGMHALCRLTFDLGGKYDEFKATLGIDSSLQGKGDCQFRVLGDEVELFSRRIKGTDEPFELSLDVRGVKELVLAAEPGEGLDLADHANWADARLLRSSASKAGKP